MNLNFQILYYSVSILCFTTITKHFSSTMFRNMFLFLYKRLQFFIHSSPTHHHHYHLLNRQHYLQIFLHRIAIALESVPLRLLLEFLLLIYIGEFLLLIYIGEFLLLIYIGEFLLLIYIGEFLLL